MFSVITIGAHLDLNQLMLVQAHFQLIEEKKNVYRPTITGRMITMCREHVFRPTNGIRHDNKVNTLTGKYGTLEELTQCLEDTLRDMNMPTKYTWQPSKEEKRLGARVEDLEKQLDAKEAENIELKRTIALMEAETKMPAAKRQRR